MTYASSSRSVDGFNVSKSISISSGFESLRDGSRDWMMCTTRPSLSPVHVSSHITLLLMHTVRQQLLNSHSKVWSLCHDAVHLSVCSYVCLSRMPCSGSHQRCSICFIRLKNSLTCEIYGCSGCLQVRSNSIHVHFGTQDGTISAHRFQYSGG